MRIKYNDDWKIAVPVLVVLLIFTIINGCSRPGVTKPQVVVNVPSQPAHMAEMTDPPSTGDVKVISGDKATLWYNVYKSTMVNGWNPMVAADAANKAVDKAYGRQ